MNQLAALQPNMLSQAMLQEMQGMTASELSENVGQNFAVVSIRGKVFRIKHGGNEQAITMEMNGQNYAAPYIDVVIPKANPTLAKTYYASKFSENSDAQPDCYSEDGIHPLVATPIHNDCRTCPFNQFGSKITEEGKKAKMCADTRKTALLPMQDLVNDRFGGPMLLRVPAASLQSLAEYDGKLRASGIPYFAVVTRISFDQQVAYPKLTFEAVRMLSDAEAQVIIETRKSPRLDDVLSMNVPLPVPAVTHQPVNIPGAMPAAMAQETLAPIAANPAPVYTGQHLVGTPVPAPVAAPVQTFAAPAPAAAVVNTTFAAPLPITPTPVAGGTFGPAPTVVQNAAPAPQPVSFGTAPVQPVQQAAAAPAPANTAAPTLSPQFFESIDSLLQS